MGETTQKEKNSDTIHSVTDVEDLSDSNFKIYIKKSKINNHLICIW